MGRGLLLVLVVVVLVVVFKSSTHLSNIYGVAVTGTFVLDTTLFIAVAHYLWRTPTWRLALLAVVYYIVEIAFFSSNLAKIKHGAYLSLIVGLAIAFLMITWRKGREIVTRNRLAKEGPLGEFSGFYTPAAPQPIAG